MQSTAPVLALFLAILAWGASSVRASLIPEDFLTLPPFSVTMQGKRAVSGEMVMKVWRVDSWDAQSQVRLETGQDPDRLYRQILQMTNLGPVAAGVLWMPKRELESGTYRLDLRYRNFEDRWVVLDLLLDLPETQYEIVRSSRVASSKPIEGRAGRKFTLNPTNGIEETFTLEFRLLGRGELSLTITHSGLGEKQPLMLAGVELHRVAD